MPRPKKEQSNKTSTIKKTPTKKTSIDIDEDFENTPIEKKQTINKEKLKAADKMADKIREKYGNDAIMKGKRAVEKTKKIFIPTPSIELNIALCGGFIKGKVTELYGPESSGKTELILNTIGKRQKEDPNFIAGWLETEGSVDLKDAIEKHGIDEERFHLIPFNIDKGAEESLEIVRAVISECGVFDLIGINSVAGLTPKEEMQKNMNESVIALQARMMSKFFRVTNAIADNNGIAIVFTNQERDNIGSYGGGPTTGGGKALRFWAWQRVRLTKEFITKEKHPGVDPRKIIAIRAKVTKNRAATDNPFKECLYFAEYGKGINVYADIATIVKRENICVEVKGAWIYHPSKDNVKIDKHGKKMAWQGVKEFREYLENNEKFFNFLYKKVNLFIRKEKKKGTELGSSLSEEEIDAIKDDAKINTKYIKKVDKEIKQEEIDENEGE